MSGQVETKKSARDGQSIPDLVFQRDQCGYQGVGLDGRESSRQRQKDEKAAREGNHPEFIGS
ncbi:MAG: hypothetical protein HPY30_16940 [Gammaproteobacteria bacterium (ex Lamellibrachia satsuma)]|nr:MAG: hypothetical protein HPY30_16940 [Gammaproteobacteria bacterium (ex Lamellibrachia satsuma)]